MGGRRGPVGLTLATLFCLVESRCPLGCACLTDTQVFCENAGLISVPGDVPDSVEHLSLAGNRISSLGDAVFQRLRNIRTLMLDDNKITHLAPFTFLGLENVEEVSLQNNPLKVLGQFSLSGLRNITYLLIANNSIRRIKSYAFMGVESVRVLMLSRNPTRVLEREAFAGLRRVNHLFLPEGLRRITPGAFMGMAFVVALRLREARLARLSAGTFAGLDYVTYLGVENSVLGALQPGWTSDLGQVEHLNLEDNQIDELAGVDLWENVRFFSFHKNRVLSVPTPRVFDLAPTVNVSITANYFPCTCQIHHVIDSLKQYNYFVPQFLRDNFCLTPLPLHGRTINKVNVTNIARCRVVVNEQEREKSSKGEVRLPSPATRLSPPLALMSLCLLAAGLCVRPVLGYT